MTLSRRKDFLHNRSNDNRLSSKEFGRLLAERVRGILATRGLTLYRVAANTRAKYPADPRRQLPANFLFLLRSAGWTPTIHQVCALSEESGYRLADWLTVFGFCLDDIPRVQASVAYPRTALIDNTTYDPRTEIPWFRERLQPLHAPPIAPLSQLLEPSRPQRLSSLGVTTHHRFLYAKIGMRDAIAFPDLAPGSVVRADPRLLPTISGPNGPDGSNHLFLVEHADGFCCARLRFGTKNRVAVLSKQLPFGGVNFELGSELQVLGAVDLEIRSLLEQGPSTNSILISSSLPADFARMPKRGRRGPLGSSERLPLLLRTARHRAGLSFREASELSRAIALTLRDKRFFTAQASLSDYETRDLPPRHIHKLLTLSILYSIRFDKLLSSFGLRFLNDRQDTIPDQWMTSFVPRGPERHPAFTSERPITQGFLSELRDRFVEFPFFLRDSLDSLLGVPNVSLRDVFWVAPRSNNVHPSLVGALFVAVSRRRRGPLSFPRKPPHEWPLYLLMRRDGSYFLASCRLENGMIVAYPEAESFGRPEQFRNRVDVEVVGRIVSVVRSVLEPTSPQRLSNSSHSVLA